jgi:hypothetical protein
MSMPQPYDVDSKSRITREREKRRNTMPRVTLPFHSSFVVSNDGLLIGAQGSENLAADVIHPIG